LTDQLTADLLEEIKMLLGRSDIRHGMAFKGMEQGLTAEQIATQWQRSPGHVRSIMRSVRYLLDGELPTGKDMAYTNSFAYRELWERGASPQLLEYLKACLRELAALHPDVKIEPMGDVSFPGEKPRRTSRRAESFCPNCFLALPCDCD
jgi:hypothetical protein